MLAGLLFMSFFLGAIYLDGLGLQLQPLQWRSGLSLPLLITYLLAIQPLLRRLFVSTMREMRALVLLEKQEFLQFIDANCPLSRRREGIAIGFGVLLGLLIGHPWEPKFPFWFHCYELLGESFLFGLLGWFIFNSLGRTHLLTVLRRQPMDIHAFRSKSLEPIVRWSLGPTLALIGFIFLSIPLKEQWGSFDLADSIVYGLLLAVTLLIFLTSRSFSILFSSVYRSKALYALCLFMANLAGGTIGYCLIEGWPPFDALYMTVITVTTIGYGEVHYLDQAGRLFTIFLSLTSIGIAGYSISVLAIFVVEGEFESFFRGKRMNQKIANLKQHIILCGGGRVGEQVALELYRTHTSFVIIEKHLPSIQHLLVSGEMLYVQGDATDDETLHLAGIERAKGLVAALGDDKENVFIVLSARSLNPKLRIVARLTEQSNAPKLRKAGADEIISPNAIGGMRIASMMIRPSAVSFLDEMMRVTGSTFSMEEVQVTDIPILVDRTLREAALGQRTGLIVIAIKSSDGRYQFNAKGQTILKNDDTLIVMGTQEQIETLRQLDQI